MFPSDSDERPEFSLINWIARNASSSPEVSLGIGDDAAILAPSPEEWVVTKDVITSGVHFDESTPLELVGRKALAVNLSDIAAMAARPVVAFIGIVLPRSFTRTQAETLLQGIQSLAAEWDVAIAGGDTNSWDGPLVVSVTVMGLVTPGTAVRRDGAKPGDGIFVTGPLGGSLRSDRHLRFTPRLREAAILKQSVTLHSMMDLSDGLGSDLFHLLNRSGVGARLIGESIPIHDDVDPARSPRERLYHALSDGEDFELLFTVSAAKTIRLMNDPPEGVTPIRIGTVTESREVILVWGENEEPFPRSGWSHGFGGDGADC
ncbi:MAG TPA: thiamine-phosphate kinase [Planctomicrobium sp.]|nr:thiamine-phosphate kinase [Planctomicrobium sp.]